MLFGGLTPVGPRNHLLDGCQDPHRKGQFGKVSGLWKALGVSAVVYSAKWIIQSSVTVWQPIAVFLTSQCSITWSPWKFCHPAMRRFVIIFLNHLSCLLLLKLHEVHSNSDAEVVQLHEHILCCFVWVFYLLRDDLLSWRVCRTCTR